MFGKEPKIIFKPKVILKHMCLEFAMFTEEILQKEDT